MWTQLFVQGMETCLSLSLLELSLGPKALSVPGKAKDMGTAGKAPRGTFRLAGWNEMLSSWLPSSQGVPGGGMGEESAPWADFARGGEGCGCGTTSPSCWPGQDRARRGWAEGVNAAGVTGWS